MPSNSGWAADAHLADGLAPGVDLEDADAPLDIWTVHCDLQGREDIGVSTTALHAGMTAYCSAITVGDGSR